MKVLHLTDDMSLLGGVQRYLSTLGEILPEHGVDCTFWAPEPGPLHGLAGRWYGRRSFLRVRDLIDTVRPDVVHAHNVWMRLSPLPLRAAAEAGVPVVMTLHDYAWVCPRKWMITGDDRACDRGFGWWCATSSCRGSREGRRWMPYNALRWAKTGWQRGMLIRWVDRFISPSRHLGQWMERSLGIDGVEHVPNFALPVLDGEVRPVDRPETLVFAGRLSREKGVDILLRATAALVKRHPQARLVVAGDGPERGDLERLSVELGLESVARFAGSLEIGELGRLYAGAGLVVLPTLWMENCPVSVLEAFAHGRAVVASRVGGVPELVLDGQTGALFDRGDAEGLAIALAGLMDVPEQIESMGRLAAKAWSERYTPRIHAGLLSAVYDRAVTGKV